jgi:osmotically-inducible protein OsmY
VDCPKRKSFDIELKTTPTKVQLLGEVQEMALTCAPTA